MLIQLAEWAKENFSPAPHRNTIIHWIKTGKISPSPVFIGRAYFVDREAKFTGAKKVNVPTSTLAKRSNHRPRTNSRIDWPMYLYARKRSKGLYYIWKHPFTGKEYGIGYDFDDAVSQAEEANLKLNIRQQDLVIDSSNTKIDEASKLETKDAHSLTSHPFSVLTGIYFLFSGCDVVYVGKSINIVTRVHQHNSDGKVFDRFAYIEVPENLLDIEERKYIRMYSPKYNVSHNKHSIR